MTAKPDLVHEGQLTCLYEGRLAIPAGFFAFFKRQSAAMWRFIFKPLTKRDVSEWTAVISIAIGCTVIFAAIASWQPLFYDGGWWFNYLSIALTGTGAAISILAFWIAIRQIAEVRIAAEQAQGAAEAARHAVETVQNRMAAFAGMQDLTEICSFSASASSLFHGQHYDAAYERLSDLIRAIERSRNNERTQILLPLTDWNRIQLSLTAVQDVLIRQKLRQTGTSQQERAGALRALHDIDMTLTRVREASIQQLGEQHVNPE